MKWSSARGVGEDENLQVSTFSFHCVILSNSALPLDLHATYYSFTMEDLLAFWVENGTVPLHYNFSVPHAKTTPSHTDINNKNSYTYFQMPRVGLGVGVGVGLFLD